MRVQLYLEGIESKIIVVILVALDLGIEYVKDFEIGRASCRERV